MASAPAAKGRGVLGPVMPPLLGQDDRVEMITSSNSFSLLVVDSFFSFFSFLEHYTACWHIFGIELLHLMGSRDFENIC